MHKQDAYIVCSNLWGMFLGVSYVQCLTESRIANNGSWRCRLWSIDVDLPGYCCILVTSYWVNHAEASSPVTQTSPWIGQ